MSNSNQTSEVTKKTIGERLNFLFFIVALSFAMLVILFIRGQSFFANIFKLHEQSIAIEASNWDVPMFLALPCFISLIAALVLRLIDLDTEKRIQRCVGVAVIFALLSIAVRIPYGFALRYYMESLSYSSCWPLTSPSIMAPTLWVRNSGYCIEDAGSVRKPLLQWIDGLPNGGANVTPNEVRTKAEALLRAFDQEQTRT